MRELVISLIIVALCVGQVSGQSLSLSTEVEGVPAISLTLQSSPSAVQKDVWMNWTLRLHVEQYNPTWNTSNDSDHPTITLMLKGGGINYNTYNNVSFGLNRTSEAISLSFEFTASMHVFTFYYLGNLSGIDSLVLVASIRIGTNMPDVGYTAEFSLYDPKQPKTTTTIGTTTTTQTPNSTGTNPVSSLTETSSTTPSQMLPLLEQRTMSVLLIIGGAAIAIIAVVYFGRGKEKRF